MKLFITGAMGFVGQNLARTLREQGHEVTGVDLVSPDRIQQQPCHRYVAGDTTKEGTWQSYAGDAEAVINLAGKNIFTYWTGSVRDEIYHSRILTTRHLAAAMDGSATLVSTSAAGYYGDKGNQVLDETSPPGRGFLSQVCRDWETEALQAREKGVRVVLPRFGVILHGSGGALATMIPFFKACLGGRLGPGTQWFPWIHLQDLIRAMAFVLSHEEISGPVNFCAPGSVTNQMFTRALADTLNRPAPFAVPAFALKTVMDGLGKALLDSQKTIPAKLEHHGFSFDFPTVEAALDDLLSGKRNTP